MMGLGSTHTDVFNHPIANIAKDDALVMARCGSFTAPGTLLRINDTSVGEMSRRIPNNYLQYAASGAPNVYSDTVGFKRMKGYSEQVVRHAWLMALTAGMAIGESPEAWSEKQQAIFKKPFDFHYRFGPYLYDAAVKAHETGYPHTLAPLGIAYAEDENTHGLAHFQWLAGESLLCTPLVKDYQGGRMDVYLPEGTWFDFDTGAKHVGPKLLEDFAMPVDKTPCFVGGEGILVTRQSDDAPLRARVYPVDRSSQTFTFDHPDGEATSTITFRGEGQEFVVSESGGAVVEVEAHAPLASFSFELRPGGHYEVHYQAAAAE